MNTPITKEQYEQAKKDFQAASEIMRAYEAQQKLNNPKSQVGGYTGVGDTPYTKYPHDRRV